MARQNPKTTAAAAPVASTPPRRWPPWLAPASIFAVTFLAYFPAFRAGFIWNDSELVTAPALRSFRGLFRIWFELGATEQYYPVLHTAFWLQHRLWGDAPLGYHLVNILCHAGCACLLTTVLRRLAVPGAWLAGLLFALHPVCVESVAWITELKNTLSTLFYLGAALVYLDFDESRSSRAYRLACGLFVLALLSKSVTASLPAALLVAFWWKRGQIDPWKDVRPLLPWFAAAGAMGLLTIWVEHHYVGASGAEFALSTTARALLAGRLFWFYLGKLVWPAGLIFIYPRWQVDTGAVAQWLFLLGALAALGGLWRLRKKSRAPLAAFLFFAGTLFPVMGFFNVYGFRFSFVADHWQYLACVGPIALSAATLATFRLERFGGAILLAVLGALAWRQTSLYRNMESFYRLTLAQNPTCWMAHHNLAKMLLDSGRLDEALAQAGAAAYLKTDDAEIENTFGATLAQAGRTTEALTHYEAALRLRPNYADAAYNLGMLLRDQGKFSDAAARLGDAIRFRPDFADAWNGLGLCLQDLGQPEAAMTRFEHALQIDARHFEALNNLANAQLKSRHFHEAIPFLRRAVAAYPDAAEPRTNLGVALAQSSQLEDAVAEFRAGLKFHPNAPEIHADLGIVLLQAGRPAEALPEFQRLVQLRPADPTAHAHLARVLQQLGRERDAAAEFQRSEDLSRPPAASP